MRVESSVWGDVYRDLLCTVIVMAELLVIEKLACGMTTPTSHLYSPPRLVRRDITTSDSRGETGKMDRSDSFLSLVPLGPTHS